MFCVTQEGRDRQAAEAAKAYRPYIGAGHAAESPSNEVGRPRVSGPGELAEGHRVTAGPFGMTGLDGQPARVRPSWRAQVSGDGPMAAGVRDQRPGAQGIEATVVTRTGDGAPPGSSYHEHAAATDVVQHMPAAAAAGPGLAGQLGAAAPTGVPVQPPVHVAPSRPRAGFRDNMPQAAAHGGAVYATTKGA